MRLLAAIIASLLLTSCALKTGFRTQAANNDATEVHGSCNQQNPEGHCVYLNATYDSGL